MALFPAASASRLQGLRFIYYQDATQKILSIARLNRAFGGGTVGDLDEPEASRLTGNPIPHQLDFIRRKAGAFKEIAHIGAGCLKREIANVKPHRFHSEALHL
jgi:hypothetical protein